MSEATYQPRDLQETPVRKIERTDKPCPNCGDLMVIGVYKTLYGCESCGRTYPVIDHDDRAILQAARAAGFPNAVMTNEINWHNRVVFDVDAIGENIQKRSAELKARIDARSQAAAERYNKTHPTGANSLQG